MNDALGRPERMRLDKWLWAARFFKTRALACEAIDKGRVSVNGIAAKASRELRPGDLISLRQGDLRRTVLLKELSHRRGPASAAQLLYEETAESLALRARLEEQRRHRAGRSTSFVKNATCHATLDCADGLEVVPFAAMSLKRIIARP